jgi:hypothetical protein
VDDDASRQRSFFPASNAAEGEHRPAGEMQVLRFTAGRAVKIIWQTPGNQVAGASCIVWEALLEFT